MTSNSHVPALAVRRRFLRRYQQETAYEISRMLERVRGETFTVMFPRQAGKNEVSAALVTHLLLANAHHGGTVVICAPTTHPQARISMERTVEHLSVFASNRLSIRVSESANTVRAGRARAVYLSASPAAHVAGHTASIALIGDEAQDIDADWFNRQFRPMAASTGASTVLLGTAWNGKTLLERAAKANIGRRAGPFPLHHQVDWRKIAKSLPVYGEYVRAERERLGAGHPAFETQYELRPSEFVAGMFSAAQLAALAGGHERLAAPLAGERYVAGLDFGGEGDGADRTVLTIARVTGSPLSCEVVAFREWQGAGFAQLWDELGAALLSWRPERVLADATGLGAPLIAGLKERLAAQGSLPGFAIEGVTFTPQLKAELGYGLLAALNAGTLALYKEADASRDRCLREFAACRSELVSGGGMRWGNEAGNDDYPVSVALALRAASTAGPARIASGRRRT